MRDWFSTLYETAHSPLVELRSSQFLGRISSPLYLVHMPTIFSLSCGVYNGLVQQYGFRTGTLH